MTFSGAASAINAALGPLRYTGNANFNGGDTITQTVTAGSVTDTETVAVVVAAVNDAPFAVNDVVRLLSGQMATGNVLANDSEAEGSALSVTQFSWGGTTAAAGQTVTLAGVGALTIRADGGYSITPAAGYTGAVPVATYTVTEGALTSTATLVFLAEWVNDAPSGADKTITMLEDSSYSFSAADFGFTDPLDNPANALKAVVITTLPTQGTMTLAGVAVTAGQTVLAADLGSLVYTPRSHFASAAHATFTFQVVDDGGTVDGGIDTDPTPNRITIDLTQVNDPPSGADKTITALQDGSYGFAAADFGFSDELELHALKAVVITTLPTHGTLTLGGVAVSAGQTILAADIGTLVWRPMDGGVAGYASFTFQVVDDGGVADGGLDTDATPNRIMWLNFSPRDGATNGDFTSGGTGWTASFLQIESRFANFGIPVSPTGGSFAELEGTGSGSPGSSNAIWQSVTTRAGEAYIFSTDAVTRKEGGNVGDRISFIAGGVTLNTVTTGDTWASYSAAFTGNVDFTQVKLQSAGSVSGSFAGADDGRGGMVDNVRVQELNTTPAGPLTAVKDTQATFKGFTVATNATGDLTVTLSAGNGTLTLADTTGLTFTVGDGTADQTMTFSGTGIAVGAALSTLRYTGAAGFIGADTITQTVTAGVTSGSTTDTDTVTVNVLAANDTPAAADDIRLVASGQAATGFVLANDSDAYGDPLLVTQFVWGGTTTAAGGTATIAGVGTLTIGADGAYVFTPAPGYGGAVPPATYMVSDGSLTATAMLAIASETRNIVVNGGFEMASTGWTAPGIEISNIYGNYGIIPSPTGGNFVELEGQFVNPPAVSNWISQVITTKTGEAYIFSTDAVTRAQANVGDMVAFMVDGATLSTVTTSGIWGSYSTAFTAAAATTTIRLQSAGSVSGTKATADDRWGGMIDNVQVQELSTTPVGPLTGAEDAEVSFTGFTVATNAQGVLTVSLAAAKGVLTLAGTDGLTFTAGDGTADQTMTFSGTGIAISTALATLRYTGAAGFIGTDTITQTVTSGTMTATDTVTVNVAEANDAPSGADRTITLAEDGSHAFTAADFGFTDPNDSPANGLKAVVITTLPTQGTLTLGGVAVSAGQSVLAGQLGSLVWRPAADASGAGYASFTFQVVDDGGTATAAWTRIRHPIASPSP